MTVNISVVADGNEEDIADYLRGIAAAVAAGQTHGSFPDGRHWEFDEFVDERVS